MVAFVRIAEEYGRAWERDGRVGMPERSCLRRPARTDQARRKDRARAAVQHGDQSLLLGMAADDFGQWPGGDAFRSHAAARRTYGADGHRFRHSAFERRTAHCRTAGLPAENV